MFAICWFKNITETLIINLNLSLITVCDKQVIPSAANLMNTANFNNGNKYIIIININIISVVALMLRGKAEWALEDEEQLEGARQGRNRLRPEVIR